MDLSNLSDLGQGAVIAGIGMALVFLGLSVLMLLIMGLRRVFRPAEVGDKAVPAAEVEAPTKVDGEIVAAISTTIASLMEEEEKAREIRRKPMLAQRLDQQPSAWRMAGRPQLMASRERKREQR